MYLTFVKIMFTFLTINIDHVTRDFYVGFERPWKLWFGSVLCCQWQRLLWCRSMSGLWLLIYWGSLWFVLAWYHPVFYIFWFIFVSQFHRLCRSGVAVGKRFALQAEVWKFKSKLWQTWVVKTGTAYSLLQRLAISASVTAHRRWLL